MLDAAHIITPVSVTHRKTSNQRVILVFMSPPARFRT
jgi:hypothetical protein